MTSPTLTPLLKEVFGVHLLLLPLYPNTGCQSLKTNPGKACDYKNAILAQVYIKHMSPDSLMLINTSTYTQEMKGKRQMPIDRVFKNQ